MNKGKNTSDLHFGSDFSPSQIELPATEARRYANRIMSGQQSGHRDDRPRRSGRRDRQPRLPGRGIQREAEHAMALKQIELNGGAA